MRVAKAIGPPLPSPGALARGRLACLLELDRHAVVSAVRHDPTRGRVHVVVHATRAGSVSAEPGELALSRSVAHRLLGEVATLRREVAQVRPRRRASVTGRSHPRARTRVLRCQITRTLAAGVTSAGPSATTTSTSPAPVTRWVAVSAAVSAAARAASALPLLPRVFRVYAPAVARLLQSVAQLLNSEFPHLLFALYWHLRSRVARTALASWLRPSGLAWAQLAAVVAFTRRAWGRVAARRFS